MTEQTEQITEQPVIDPVVNEAVAQGWVPKEEFQGDEHKWVDAGEFLRRGELFKKIDQVSRTAKRAEQTLAEFKAHYAKVKETEYQHALTTLKAERKAALVDGDYAKVDDIETRMDAVKEEASTVQAEIKQQPEQQVYPEVAEWVERNKWYNQDLPMKAYADTVAAQLNRQGITGSALLKGIDDEIRKAFPTKFSNPNRERPGAVESSTTKGNSRRESYELSEQEQRIMNTFVRDGVMTREQYIADLKKVKGVK
jgi:hypothetical protein